MSELFSPFQPIAAIATTPTAVKTLYPIWETGAVTLWIPESLAEVLTLSSQHPTPKLYRHLSAHLTSLWQTHRSLVFCLATGAVVRLIAPYLQNKAIDPAVVVVDGTGRFVISLCSGHQGGADALTRTIAAHLGATPVLTGGSTSVGLPAIDQLGIPFGWTRGSGDWTGVSAAVARQAPIQVIQEAGNTLWQQHLPSNHPFLFEGDTVEGTASPPEPAQVPLANPSPQARIWISPIQRRFAPESTMPKVQWHPRVLWIGIGCERGTSRQLIETAIHEVCRAYHLAEGSIAGIATIDLKANEPGIIELCRDRRWPLRCFSAEQLRVVAVPTPSTIVAAEVGTPSVAEAAAMLASAAVRVENQEAGSWEPGSNLRVTKKIVRDPEQAGAVTVAIAEADQEYTGRSGQLWLVGTGPGQLSQMTQAAQAAITQADVVIGYKLYVELIESLLRPGQMIEALPITQERQRANRAIELAQWGLSVAVISSGDCGIYGMAGLVLEQLQAQGWDGKTPSVQVIPGISALQAAASKVGAPLMHDFCAISLSDLLTPWEVIEQRLVAAAQADFVTALYNPRSQTRTQQIGIAQQIFLQHRDPTTPVALVRSAYRSDEQITLTTLSLFLEEPIDMVTTVIIGNRSTRTHANWMITPRGYEGNASGKGNKG
ncbi:precorrin-3B C(17)-methyltransferase [Thermocoleostomius sinensis]|uniref:Precorrin-3B C(17)-methyltransferase n=1 Tax=Thermocoleostomius sinensis A174 TaxID=2016057 RepID=A0A9E8ZDZ8_9CYAN|nr:precorrin-3B C(17)-methyltransferase [Thermocoleostomius sinensis]WAL61584.1 precorrin-3B C(17)-methyltransferase [Thermocoleostomius sinensis A174]